MAVKKSLKNWLDTARQTVEQIMETENGYTTKPFEEIDE